MTVGKHLKFAVECHLSHNSISICLDLRASQRKFPLLIMTEFWRLFVVPYFNLTLNIDCATTNVQKNKKSMTIWKNLQIGTYSFFPRPSISFRLEIRAKWILWVVLKAVAKLWPIDDWRSDFENIHNHLKMYSYKNPSYNYVQYMQNCK